MLASDDEDDEFKDVKEKTTFNALRLRADSVGVV
jgi:hypothetical protein